MEQRPEQYWTYPLYVYVWKSPNNILDRRFQCLVRQKCWFWFCITACLKQIRNNQ